MSMFARWHHKLGDNLLCCFSANYSVSYSQTTYKYASGYQPNLLSKPSGTKQKSYKMPHNQLPITNPLGCCQLQTTNPLACQEVPTSTLMESHEEPPKMTWLLFNSFNARSLFQSYQSLQTIKMWIPSPQCLATPRVLGPTSRFLNQELLA